LKAEIVAICSGRSEATPGGIVCLVHRFLSGWVLIAAFVRVTNFLCLTRTDFLRHTTRPEAVPERISRPIMQTRQTACSRCRQRLVGQPSGRIRINRTGSSDLRSSFAAGTRIGFRIRIPKQPEEVNAPDRVIPDESIQIRPVPS